MKKSENRKQLRNMDPHDLKERYNELTKELFNLRFQAATAQLSSPARFKQVRREITRIITIAQERNLNIF
jgi:large subunit ribosomal protein L29